MVKCLTFCFPCFRFLWFSSPTQVRNEKAQKNHYEAYSDSNTGKIVATSEEAPPNSSPGRFESIRPNIIMERRMRSENICVEFDFEEEQESHIEDISKISEISYKESLSPINIPTPEARENQIVPFMFAPCKQGRMPRLNPVMVKSKIPKNKISLYIE